MHTPRLELASSGRLLLVDPSKPTDEHRIKINYEQDSEAKITLAFIKVSINNQLQWVVAAPEFVLSIIKVNRKFVSNRLTHCRINTNHRFVFGKARMVNGQPSRVRMISLTAVDAFQFLNTIIDRNPTHRVAKNAAALCQRLFVRKSDVSADSETDTPEMIIKKYQSQWAAIVEMKAKKVLSLPDLPVKLPLGPPKRKSKKITKSDSQGIVPTMPHSSFFPLGATGMLPAEPMLAPVSIGDEIMRHHARSASASLPLLFSLEMEQKKFHSIKLHFKRTSVTAARKTTLTNHSMLAADSKLADEQKTVPMSELEDDSDVSGNEPLTSRESDDASSSDLVENEALRSRNASTLPEVFMLAEDKDGSGDPKIPDVDDTEMKLNLADSSSASLPALASFAMKPADNHSINLHFKGTSATEEKNTTLYFKNIIINHKRVWVVAATHFNESVYPGSNKSVKQIMARMGIESYQAIPFNISTRLCIPFTAEGAYKRLQDLFTQEMNCKAAIKKVVIANAVELLKQLFERKLDAPADIKGESASAMIKKYLPKWAAAVESKQLNRIDLTSCFVKPSSVPDKKSASASVVAPSLKIPGEQLAVAVSHHSVNVHKKRKRQTPVDEDVNAMAPVPLTLPSLSTPRLDVLGFFSSTPRTNSVTPHSIAETDFKFAEEQKNEPLPKLKCDGFMLEAEQVTAKEYDSGSSSDFEAKAFGSRNASVMPGIFSPVGDMDGLGSLKLPDDDDTDRFNKDGLDLLSLSLLQVTKRQRTV